MGKAMFLRWWAILCKVSTKSLKEPDLIFVNAGALGVNMTVNKLKEGERSVIEAEELALKKINAIHQEVSENLFSGTFVSDQMICMIASPS